MSVVGQKQTLTSAHPMSAIGGKADIEAWLSDALQAMWREVEITWGESVGELTRNPQKMQISA